MRLVILGTLVVLISGYDAAGQEFTPDQRSTSITSEVTCGDKIVQKRDIYDYEDTRVELTFRNINGEQIFPLIQSRGIFVSLCEENAFLLLDNSAHFRPGRSFLLSKDLNVMSVFEFGEIADFGKSSDDKIFWVQSYHAENRRPITRLRIYTASGQEKLDMIFEEAKEIILDHEDVRYIISVLRPDFPG